MSELFVNINTELLEEANRVVSFTYYDGEGQLQAFSVNVPPEFKNPYTLDISPFIPQTRIFNLDRFFELSKQLIDNASSREGKPTVAIVEEYPPVDMEKLGNEVITYRLISREPAKMNADASDRAQKGFRNYYFTKDPNYSDNLFEILNRPLDHEIEFVIWATTNKLANKRVIWLEDLLIKHKWVFSSQGADRFFFERRLQDGYLTTGNQKLFYRPLRFSLRFNDFFVRAHYEIKDIQINLNLVTEL